VLYKWKELKLENNDQIEKPLAMIFFLYSCYCPFFIALNIKPKSLYRNKVLLIKMLLMLSFATKQLLKKHAFVD
jgi:hypothetical protein